MSPIKVATWLVSAGIVLSMLAFAGLIVGPESIAYPITKVIFSLSR